MQLSRSLAITEFNFNSLKGKIQVNLCSSLVVGVESDAEELPYVG